jgi:hypothetical protein
MLHTTLALLRQFKACGQDRPDDSYNKLRASLPSDLADDTPITLVHILGSNGIEDTIWALRATVEPTGKDVARELACRAAERVLPSFEKRLSPGKRPRECIEAARAYGRGEISLAQLRKKRADADADADADACFAAADACFAAAYVGCAARKAEREAQADDMRELLGSV